MLSGEAAVYIHTTNVVGHGTGHLTTLADNSIIPAAQFGPRFIGVCVTVFEFAQHGIHQFETIFGISHHIVTHIVHHYTGVNTATGATHVVCIVAKSQFGIVAARQDFLQAFFFFISTEWRVTIFNRPHIVRAYFGGVVIALLAAVQRYVYGRIIHNTTLQTNAAGNALVVYFGGAQHLAGFHVVVEAEGMPHFVQNEVIQKLLVHFGYFSRIAIQHFYSSSASHKLHGQLLRHVAGSPMFVSTGRQQLLYRFVLGKRFFPRSSSSFFVQLTLDGCTGTAAPFYGNI